MWSELRGEYTGKGSMNNNYVSSEFIASLPLESWLVHEICQSYWPMYSSTWWCRLVVQYRNTWTEPELAILEWYGQDPPQIQAILCIYHVAHNQNTAKKINDHKYLKSAFPTSYKFISNRNKIQIVNFIPLSHLIHLVQSFYHKKRVNPGLIAREGFSNVSYITKCALQHTKSLKESNLGKTLKLHLKVVNFGEFR